MYIRILIYHPVSLYSGAFTVLMPLPQVNLRAHLVFVVPVRRTTQVFIHLQVGKKDRVFGTRNNLRGVFVVVGARALAHEGVQPFGRRASSHMIARGR